MKKVTFIDRDGTLIVGPRLVSSDPIVYDEILSVDQLTILPGVFRGLALLRDAGYELVMVTNQEGLGQAYFPEQGFARVQEELLLRLTKKGIRFANIFICPHVPSEQCFCRKPKTDLVASYFAQNDIDQSRSLMIGDRESDEEFARNIGVRFIKAYADVRFPLQEIRSFLPL